MATIDEIFKDAENGTLTLEQFKERAKAANAKFADLSEGGYISKSKHDDEIASLNKQVDTLNETLSTRDSDLADIQKKLEEAGTADADKIATLTNDFNSLKTKYDDEMKSYKEQLKSQAYEFAVKEFANGQNFTSGAAKRDFINQMIHAGLKMDGSTILGATDFMTKYSEANTDAFKSKEPEPQPAPEPVKPQFVAPTGATPQPTGDNAFLNAFHFTGVRPMPTE